MNEENNRLPALAAGDTANAFDMYGRLKEGVHIAGYSFERACNHLEWLLDEDRWQLSGRFSNVNDFLDSVKLEQFRIVTDQRQRIARRIKELQPEASQRAIAKVVGASVGTINADLHPVQNRTGDNADAPENKGVETGDVQYRTPEPSGVEVAKQAKAGVEKERKKELRRADLQRQREAIARGIQLPEGPFEVVVMDPPWNYDGEYDPVGNRAAGPYPRMTQEQLMAMDPPFADDCVLFLWTTHQFIWDAKKLLDHWGFSYKASLIWNKGKIGMGRWLRMQCEFCLIGVRGNPLWQNTKWRDIIEEPRREHSRKPEIFYGMVEEITAGRRLDYFSRESRNGWVSFGNDTEKF